MRRRGHARPPGTTWRMRMHDWQDLSRPPALNDLVWEDPESLERGFKVVGVEETSKPDVFGLVLERIEWTAFLDGILRSEPSWAFVRRRR